MRHHTEDTTPAYQTRNGESCTSSAPLAHDGAIRASRAAPMRRPSERSVVQEGMLAGSFAAGGVALVYYLIDLQRGDALFTPALLGYGVGRALGVHAMTEGMMAAVAGYTVLHFTAFIVLATVVAAVVRRARRETSLLAAALLLVAVTELAFYGFVTLLGQASALAATAAPQLTLGNLLGWLLLAGWMWHAHPEVGEEFAHMVHGDEAPATR